MKGPSRGQARLIHPASRSALCAFTRRRAVVRATGDGTWAAAETRGRATRLAENEERRSQSASEESQHSPEGRRRRVSPGVKGKPQQEEGEKGTSQKTRKRVKVRVLGLCRNVLRARPAVSPASPLSASRLRPGRARATVGEPPRAAPAQCARTAARIPSERFSTCCLRRITER